MRRLVAAALFVGAVAGGVGVPAAIGGAPACAATTGPHAGLVVVTDSGTDTFCVALADTEVSGLELIELAHAQGGLPYRFGNGGLAVCQLEGVGPSSGSDCFADYPDFWGYWHGDGAGGWTWASTGAGCVSSSATATWRQPGCGEAATRGRVMLDRPRSASTMSVTPSRRHGRRRRPRTRRRHRPARPRHPLPDQTRPHPARRLRTRERRGPLVAVALAHPVAAGGRCERRVDHGWGGRCTPPRERSDPPAGANRPVGLLVAVVLGIALVVGGCAPAAESIATGSGRP